MNAERKIVSQIEKYLKSKKILYYKFNDSFTAGILDILAMKESVAFLRPRYIWFEVKTPVGKLSKIQQYTLKKFETLNAEAYVVVSLLEVMEIVEKEIVWIK